MRPSVEMSTKRQQQQRWMRCDVYFYIFQFLYTYFDSIAHVNSRSSYHLYKCATNVRTALNKKKIKKIK